jgi:hypothetical protein
MNTRRALILVEILALLACVGCSPTSVINLVPVEGRLIIDGRPAHGCVVIFEPCDTGATTGPQSIGFTDVDGRFRLVTSGNRIGTVQGKHRVSVIPNGEAAMTVGVEAGAEHSEKPPVTDLVPKRYQSAETSGLEANVTRGAPNSFVFELHTRTGANAP